MPRMSKRSRARTLQIISARLLEKSTMVPFALDTSLLRHTSTSWEKSSATVCSGPTTYPQHTHNTQTLKHTTTQHNTQHNTHTHQHMLTNPTTHRPTQHHSSLLSLSLAHAHANAHVHARVFVYVCRCICTCVCTCVCMCKCERKCKCVKVYVYVHTYMFSTFHNGLLSNTGLFLPTSNMYLSLFKRHLSPFNSWSLLLFQFSRARRHQIFAIEASDIYWTLHVAKFQYGLEFLRLRHPKFVQTFQDIIAWNFWHRQ